MEEILKTGRGDVGCGAVDKSRRAVGELSVQRGGGEEKGCKSQEGQNLKERGKRPKERGKKGKR